MSEADTTADKLKPEHDQTEAPSNAADSAAAEQPDETAKAPVQAEPPEGLNLMQALIAAQQEAQSNQDGWQRARAEFANYKKRTERERRGLFQRASLDTLKELLPIIDDFDRAFENVPEDISENTWVEGVLMIRSRFETLLEKYQIEAIAPTGEPFDPVFHEAIGADETDEVESGHVTVTLQKGYRVGETVLRPALVRVAG